ncbi:hypothetical protein FOH38_23595 [Lysinibacillus fusiformis]|nr:hypothetical protein FOH38_23595 [Lysinibacillus fusiformis]
MLYYFFIIVIGISTQGILTTSIAMRAVYSGDVASSHPAYEAKHDRNEDVWGLVNDNSIYSTTVQRI